MKTPAPVPRVFREIDYNLALVEPYPTAWMDPSIPPQQLALVLDELKTWCDGGPMILFDTLKSALEFIKAPLPPQELSVLEIGCGVGHNSIVVGSVDNTYTGVDYSEHCINLAREYFSEAGSFEVMNALHLTYPTLHFDIVVSSACILHIFDWQTAVSEAATVSKRYLILHRTPISRNNKTRYFLKAAYGVKVLEIWFSEHDLFERIKTLGFELKKVWTTSEDAQCSYRTYLLERIQLSHHQV